MSNPNPIPRSPWILRGLLVLLALVGAAAYSQQYFHGLSVTGLSKDAPWGLYISQFTFLVGIGASSVVVLLPSAVHRHPSSDRLLLLGELLAVIALGQAMLLVVVDLGQPQRVLNVLLYPSPRSLMFWDILTLGGYVALCFVLLGCNLRSSHSHDAGWCRALSLLAVPWAFAIHIVTALLYAGLAARPAWMTAILAPRFLATAFASGSALLLLLVHLPPLRRALAVPGPAIRLLANVMTYALAASLLFAGLEVFTALYSGVPTSTEHIRYLLSGLNGKWGLTPWTYATHILSLLALALLLQPRRSQRPRLLLGGSALTFAAVFLEKGCCWVPSGFVPTPLGQVHDYRPSIIELLIVTGLYAASGLAFTEAARWLLSARPAADPAAGERTRDPWSALRPSSQPTPERQSSGLALLRRNHA